MTGRTQIVQSKQHMMTLKLIEAVKARPILYNSKRRDYRNLELKAKNWEEVCKESGEESVENCMKSWKTHRDRYIRELRVMENKAEAAERAGTSKEGIESTWLYFKELEFYKDCGRAPRTYIRRKTSLSTTPPNDGCTGAGSPGQIPSSSVMLNASSSSNMTFLSQNSSSNSGMATLQETPSAGGFRHEAATSAFREAASTKPGEQIKAESLEFQIPSGSPPMTSEHRAFLDTVMDKVTERDSEASRYALPDSSRTPLREYQPNTPLSLAGRRGVNRVPAHEELLAIKPAQPVDAENAIPGANLRSLVAVPAADQASEQGALDLRPASQSLRQLIHAPKARKPMKRSMPPDCFTATSCSPESAVVRSPPNIVDSSVMPYCVKESSPKRVCMDDEDGLFARALIPALRRLQPHRKSALKAKIMLIIAEAEFESQGQSQP